MGNRTNIYYTATRTSGCDTPSISSAVLRTVPFTVYKMKNETLTLTLNNSAHTQPIKQCNMALEPHSNSEFKTGAGIKNRTKNA